MHLAKSLIAEGRFAEAISWYERLLVAYSEFQRQYTGFASSIQHTIKGWEMAALRKEGKCIRSPFYPSSGFPRARE